MKYLEPVIKWPGSKRPIARLAAALFPPARHYFEPFVGGGSMLPYHAGKWAFAGDIIKELIELWTIIRDIPEVAGVEYERRWQRLQQEGPAAFYAIRDTFNRTRNPHDFLFLSRTCVNGLIRFNKKGYFNNSLHLTRPGIAPASLRAILLQWSQLLHNVQFVCADYRETLAGVQKDDLVFLDPPYAGNKGRYTTQPFSLTDFYSELERLNSVGAKWILTFDGRAGSRTYSEKLPPAIYTTRLSLPTGNSPFPKLMRTGIDEVEESLYLNFEPSSEVLYSLLNLRR